MRLLIFAALFLLALPAAAQSLVGRSLNEYGGVAGYVNCAGGNCFNNANPDFDIEAWEGLGTRTLVVLTKTGKPRIVDAIVLPKQVSADLELSMGGCRMDGVLNSRLVGAGLALAKYDDLQKLSYVWRLTTQGKLVVVLAPGIKNKSRIACLNPISYVE